MWVLKCVTLSCVFLSETRCELDGNSFPSVCSLVIPFTRHRRKGNCMGCSHFLRRRSLQRPYSYCTIHPTYHISHRWAWNKPIIELGLLQKETCVLNFPPWPNYYMDNDGKFFKRGFLLFSTGLLINSNLDIMDLNKLGWPFSIINKVESCPK